MSNNCIKHVYWMGTAVNNAPAPDSLYGKFFYTTIKENGFVQFNHIVGEQPKWWFTNGSISRQGEPVEVHINDKVFVSEINGYFSRGDWDAICDIGKTWDCWGYTPNNIRIHVLSNEEKN